MKINEIKRESYHRRCSTSNIIQWFPNITGDVIKVKIISNEYRIRSRSTKQSEQEIYDLTNMSQEPNSVNDWMDAYFTYTTTYID